MSAAPVRALVVDDSALVRQVLAAILEEGDMIVATASDALIATRKMARERPDVIVLDLELPHMDGLTFLHQIMQADPIPVVICSGVADRGTQLGLRALEEGAIDVIAKPTLGVRYFLTTAAPMLIETVRGAAMARLRPRRSVGASRAVHRPLPHPARRHAVKVIAFGTSTGGPDALRRILPELPGDLPAIAIVQHMPAHFTEALARRLDAECAIQVKEARSGDRLVPGQALVAPGDRHLSLHRERGAIVAEVSAGPVVSRHRPSVNVLFRSVRATCGPAAIGVLLTGMGDDGAAGLLEMHQAGAFTIAQDEASSVVFGMPREAIARHAVDEIAPLDGVAEAICRAVGSGEDHPGERTHLG
jgi:two-component system chemotaxis response regulator CheB